jgi:hypothetical protein
MYNYEDTVSGDWVYTEDWESDWEIEGDSDYVSQEFYLAKSGSDYADYFDTYPSYSVFS